jgi:hypothetical protein
VDERGGGWLHLQCLLPTAWFGVLWLVLRAVVTFVSGDVAWRVLRVLPGIKLPLSMRAHESYLTWNKCGALRSGARKQGLSFGGGNGWRWGVAWPLEVENGANHQWRSSSPTSLPLQPDRKARQWTRRSRCSSFPFCLCACCFRFLLVGFHLFVSLCWQRLY